MDRIKCTACKRQKFVSDFLKNGKTLKTCITCRAPKRSVTVDSVSGPVKTPPEPVLEKVIVPSPVSLAPLPEVVQDTKEIHRKQWIHLSGKWIHLGKERELHEECMKKMNREFLKRSAFAVHKYLTRWVMIDIRDL